MEMTIPTSQISVGWIGIFDDSLRCEKYHDIYWISVKISMIHIVSDQWSGEEQ